jgi:hypothetical protein
LLWVVATINLNDLPAGVYGVVERLREWHVLLTTTKRIHILGYVEERLVSHSAVPIKQIAGRAVSRNGTQRCTQAATAGF